jgi:CDP-glucose 4,6-dehydratase
MPFWRNRPVLVTGCSGFLGWGLTAALVEAGADVVGLVRDSVPRSPLFQSGLAAQIKITRGCVEDYVTVERVINEYEVDTVFHLAAQAIVGVANRNPMSTFETNIKGTWVVLEACRRSPCVGRVVVASSDKSYGEHEELPYGEDHALRGRHPYDVSKSCADLIATTYHSTYATPVCVTRCGNLFGPGDLNFNRIVPGTMRSILQNERPIIRSDGSPIRDYVFIADVVRGYMLLAEAMEDRTIHGKAFNFGGGEPVSVLELTQRILMLARREDLAPVIRNNANGEIRNQYLSSARAQALLDWKVGADLDARLCETFAWYEAREHAGLELPAWSVARAAAGPVNGHPPNPEIQAASYPNDGA